MRLDHMTWNEVDEHLDRGAAVMLPVGSTEQHGPMGRIGTDTICAEAVALRAAELCSAIVAPAICYTPAPFNTAFPGTVSVSVETFHAVAAEVVEGLLAQGFTGVFVVNGHGANLEPLQRIGEGHGPCRFRVMSWWEGGQTNALRRELYGDWEGMHATPSEIAMTQALLGALPTGEAATPPKPLSSDYIKAHAGDRHGPPESHRAEFPDGRVGSHSALATPEDGARLLKLAKEDVAAAFREFCGLNNPD